jgi:hypothetical protein
VALQQVGSYPGYTGRGANAFGKAVRDPTRCPNNAHNHRHDLFSPVALEGELRVENNGEKFVGRRWENGNWRTLSGCLFEEFVVAAEYLLVEGVRAQRFGVRPRMWSKPCLTAAKRASIIGSNSRSVKIYGQSFSTPSRTSSPT